MSVRTKPVTRNMWNRTLLVPAVLAGIAAILPAQEPTTATRDVIAVNGRVERIDTFSRSLTLRTPDGQMHVAYVGRDLKVFDELQTGDAVKVRIAESIILAMRPGAKLTPPIDTTQAAKKEPAAADADVLQQLKGVIRLESIDRATNVIVYMTGDNRRVTRAVADPRLLEGLNPGDVVEITYTRARAIELQKEP